jgi:hypothetical protein
MPQLLRVNRHLMKPRNHRKANQRGVDHLG